MKTPWTIFVADNALYEDFGAVLDEMGLSSEVLLQAGDIVAATDFVVENPDALSFIIDLGSHENIENLIEKFGAECPEGTQVIFLGEQDSVRFYHELMQMGVNDYLVKPLSREDIRDLLSKIKAAESTQSVDHQLTLACIPAGQCFYTANLAAECAYLLSEQQKESTCLVDTDFYTDAVSLFFKDARSNFGLNTAINESDKADEFYLKRLMFQVNDHFHLLTGSVNLQESFEINEQDVDKVAGLLPQIFHYVVLNLVLKDHALFSPLLSYVTHILLFVEPTLSSLRDANRILQYLQATHPTLTPRLVVVKNALTKKSDISTKDIEKTLDTKVTADFFIDNQILFNSLNLGELYTEKNKSSSYTKSIVNLLKKLFPEIYEKKGKDKK